MNQHFFQKTISAITMLLIMGWSLANGQHTFEVRVDSSEYLTDIPTETGRHLKFLATVERLVVLDFENYRILFYEKDTSFEDNKILNIVGQHSIVQKYRPFDPVHYNRLSGEFAGTLFKDTLWISNYSFGEILRFDLDGNYLNTLPGRYRVLDDADSSLYALDYRQIYRFDEEKDSFVFLKDLPEVLRVERQEDGTNVKLGSNRLCIKTYDSLHFYNMADYLDSDTATRLFSKTGGPIPDFEIMGDTILWANGYYGDYQLCDLDGHFIDSGNLGLYTYTYHFTGDMMYYVGSWGLKVLDRDLTEVYHTNRRPYYLSLHFLGGDTSNLYFYDLRDGGFAITPIDQDEGVFYYDPDNEIDYNGWYRGLRISNDIKYLYSEWPEDSFKIYRFDTDSMSALFFEVDSIQEFDVLEDSIYTIRGKDLKVYSNDGTFQSSYSISNLSESNLQDIDSTSEFLFAVNNGNIFIGYKGKLNVLDHTGVFEKLYDFEMNKYARLFASDMEVICTDPLNSLEHATGNVAPFMPDSAGTRGFVFENLYWYQSWTNEYAYIDADLVTVNISTPELQEQFITI
ncbi:MAG: hypothetical protein AMS23_06515 [Bacteroides sp. SM1_62]|nr:MAG: hypothetical protein AMS23_06515 [Bacteroides sp. SM1_62]